MLLEAANYVQRNSNKVWMQIRGGFKFSLYNVNMMSHSFTTLNTQNKSGISAHPCIILYVFIEIENCERGCRSNSNVIFLTISSFKRFFNIILNK